MGRKTDKYKSRFKIETPWNRLYKKYKESAKNRDISFELSYEEVVSLAKQNCSYCGIEPQEDRGYFNAKVNERIKTGLDSNYNTAHIIFRNGIDRVDNSRGYEIGNCVTCCALCNTAKRDHSKEDFIAWIHRASNYLKTLS